MRRVRQIDPGRLPPARHAAGDGEFAFIDRIRRTFSGIPASGLALGIGDDCAILRPPSPRSEILVTTDLLLEGRHFRRDLHSAASAGHRCLARGLSDLAAMGAEPIAAFLSLALPSTTLATADSRRWMRGFLHGMADLARRVPVPLAGGDTGETAGSEIMADIVLVGAAPRGEAMRRSLARAGDVLYVTGALGGAAAELQQMLLGRKLARGSLRPQRFPEPRLATGIALRRRGVRAAIDLSDGLSSDLGHLAQASGVRAVVRAADLPLHPLLRGKAPEEALQLALHGGEDYELLFAAPARLRLPAQLGGVRLTAIGSVEALAPRRPQVMLLAANGRQASIQPGGWEHFRPGGSVAGAG